MRKAFFRRRLLLILLPVLSSLIVAADSRPPESHRLLAEADRLAMLYNWPAAAPRFTRAEALFLRDGNARNALSARLGYLWVTADTGVTASNVAEVDRHLENPLVQRDSALLLRTLVTKAVLDRNTNELDARAPWQRILELAKQTGDYRWEGRAKAEIGQILYMDGDIKSAAEMLRSAIVSQYYKGDFGAALHYTALVGNGFVETGQPEAGLQYSNVVLELIRLLPDSGFPFLAYQGKARALLALDRINEAEPILDAAIAQARKDKNNFALTQLLVVAGTAAASDKADRAIEILTEAKEISEYRGFHHVFAWSAFELAKAYRDVGNLAAAESAISKCIELLRALEDRYHLPGDLTLLAELEQIKGNFTRADEIYNEVTDLIDGLLVNVSRRQLKSSLIATLSEAYVGHFDLAATKLNDPVKAFHIIETARGRSLTDTLRGEYETLREADQLSAESQKEINRIQLALLHETDKKKRQDLLDNLFALEQLLAPVTRTASALNSAAARSKPIPLRLVQGSLRSDEVLLEYVLNEPNSYCLTITRDDIEVSVLPAGRKRIEGLVDDYLEAVRSRQSDVPVSQELYSLVVKPVANLEGKSRIIIVPDSKLHLLPVDALRDSQSSYLLESKLVSYVPSATVLHLLREARSADSPPMGLVAVGGVSYSDGSKESDIAETAANFFGLDSVSFPQLPGSKQEVHAISRIVPGPSRLLLEANATETAFKALPLERFRIVHLAVHGIANAQFPDRAALILGSSADSKDDGLLQVREIRDLPLRADLVTLSACETGTGRLVGAEGIASLERAFLLAGAKAVVSSLWTADDVYTIALMKRFYGHLAAGNDKALALRQAKLDLLEEFGDQAHPIYWAGFTLVGESLSPVFK